jgi:hypothetical protein
MFRVWIRIQIRMFLGLPDPDPLVTCTDPDPPRIRILPFSHKSVQRIEIPAMVANYSKILIQSSPAKNILHFAAFKFHFLKH